jgi:Ca-activated chloride channel family protein
MSFHSKYCDHDNNRDDREFLVSSTAFRLRSAALVGVCFLLVLVPLQVEGQTSSSSSIPGRSSATGVAQSVPASDAAPARQSNGATQEKPDEQKSDQSEVFVFKTRVQEVILHAIVVDEQRRLVTNLEQPAFSILENGAPMAITSFHREDVPVAMGVVIDNSGSMHENRDKVNQAVLNLIRAGNPNDQTFVVNFSTDSYLDQDFTSNANLLQRALQKVSTQGTTALYDAIVASAVHLRNNTRVERRVLLVITDGRDNASKETLREAMRRLQQNNGPTLYAIGLLGDELKKSDIAALQSLAEVTGGVAFFPKNVDEVDEITRVVARDIHSQYTIGYKPTNGNRDGGYHAIEVRAQALGHRKLTVRTRSGYYAGQPGN